MSAHPILDLYFDESGDSLTKELSALRLKIPGLEDVSPILLPPTTTEKQDDSNRGPSPVRSLAFATTSMSPKPSYTSFNPPPPPSDPVPPVPPPRSRSRARLRPASEAQTHPAVTVASPIPVDPLEPLLPPPAACQEPSNAEQLDDMFKSSKPMVDLSHYRSLSRSATHNHFPTQDPLEMNEQRGRSHRSSSSMGGSRSRSLNRIKSSASMVANMLRGKSRSRMDSRDDTMSIQSELNRSLDSPPEPPGPPTSPSSPTLRESPFKSILRRQPKTTTTTTIVTTTTTATLEDKLDQLQQEKIAQQKQQLLTEQQQQSPKDDLDFPGMFKSFTLRRRPTGDVASPEPDSTLARKAASISGMKAELAALRAGKDLEAAAAASAEAAKAKKNAWYMNPGK
ncbi:hypothetical protein HDU77_000592 [Chytriomyces hyalinus]|nr:hypothetical protein HDU77_000592 [Chytriomyces hyalinus]